MDWVRESMDCVKGECGLGRARVDWEKRKCGLCKARIWIG